MALKTVCAAEKKKDLVSYCSAGFRLIFLKKRKVVCFDEDYTERWLWKVQELFSSSVCLLD